VSKPASNKISKLGKLVDSEKPDKETATRKTQAISRLGRNKTTARLSHNRPAKRRKPFSYDSIPSKHSEDSDFTCHDFSTNSSSDDEDAVSSTEVDGDDDVDLPKPPRARVPVRRVSESKKAPGCNLPDAYVSIMPIISEERHRSRVNVPTSVVVTFSGFRKQDSQDIQKDLANKVEELGGRWCSELNDEVTHIVVHPHHLSSAKVIYGTLRGIWLMRPTWIENSAKSGRWLDEIDFGSRAIRSPFAEKWFYLSQEFEKANPTQAGHVRTLIPLGQGGITDKENLADFVMVADDAASSNWNTRRMTFREFVSTIVQSTRKATAV